MEIRRLLGTGAAVLAMTALLVACGDSDDTSSGDNGDSVSGEASSLNFTAEDIAFAETSAQADAGQIDVSLVNEGAIEHSWLVEDHESDLRLYVEKNGDTDDGSITLEPGEYVYYCDIPGHREAGMEGTLTVQ